MQSPIWGSMIWRSLICGICSAAIFASSALAQTAQTAQTATVEPVQGNVSFSQGQGFQRVDGRVQANIGDSVMVGPDGAANVVYPDGCQASIQPGVVVTIAPLSPCASGSFAADNGSNDKPWIIGGTLAAFVVGGVILYEVTRPSAPASP
jgi:hypothetical protein